jgi:hypothetical protein
MKYASDHLTRLLEGMDRANLLLGSRPIDQFKSSLGYTVGVNDHGSAALVVVDAAAQPPRVAWLMPVSDAEAFLQGNFTGRDGEAYTRGEHTRVFARSLNSHVLLSNDLIAVQSYKPDGDTLTALASNFSTQGGNALVIIRQPMIAAVKRRALEKAERTGARLPAIAVIGSALADEIDAIVLGITFDPLALIVRGEAMFREGSQFGAHAPLVASSDAGLSRLPNKPLALALSIDVAAMGGEQMLRAMAAAAGAANADLPAWLVNSRSMQIAIAPSPAGAKGGLFNEATVTLGSSAPAQVRDSIREAVLASDDNPALAREAKWLDDQSLADGSKADAYELRVKGEGPELESQRFVEGLLFGTSGMSGYVRALNDAVVITLAQRPAVLSQACESALQASANPQTGLASSPAVKVIRQWMPAQRDVEMYLGAGQIMNMLGDFTKSLPPPWAASVPQMFDPNSPPIGLALDVSPRKVDGAAIMPAVVLAPLLDETVRYLQALRPVAPMTP